MAFDQDELEKRFSSGPKPYHEFLGRGCRWECTRCRQAAWTTSTRTRPTRCDNELEVGPGCIVSVDHGEEHRFVNIAEDLHMLVVFAPPEE